MYIYLKNYFFSEVLVVALFLGWVGIADLHAAKAPKVNICHLDQETQTYKLINVSGNAEPAHRAHGDGAPGENLPGDPTNKFSATCAIEPVEIKILTRVFHDANGDKSYQDEETLYIEIEDTDFSGDLTNDDIVKVHALPIDFDGANGFNNIPALELFDPPLEYDVISVATYNVIGQLVDVDANNADGSQDAIRIFRSALSETLLFSGVVGFWLHDLAIARDNFTFSDSILTLTPPQNNLPCSTCKDDRWLQVEVY